MKHLIHLIQLSIAEPVHPCYACCWRPAQPCCAVYVHLRTTPTAQLRCTTLHSASLIPNGQSTQTSGFCSEKRASTKSCLCSNMLTLDCGRSCNAAPPKVSHVKPLTRPPADRAPSSVLTMAGRLLRRLSPSKSTICNTQAPSNSLRLACKEGTHEVAGVLCACKAAQSYEYALLHTRWFPC